MGYSSLYACSMARIARTVALVATAMWLGWNLYRHLLVYLVRGRLVVGTPRVIANLLFAAGLLVVLAAPSVPTIAGVAVAAAAALGTRKVGLWVVGGASPERIFERAELVLRGMSFPFERSGSRTLEEKTGRIRISVIASPGGRVTLLRVRTARRQEKVALFRGNLRKFLLAIPRERR
jgi:hypothetical protein